jgi:SAM-dependent methyltransferase
MSLDRHQQSPSIVRARPVKADTFDIVVEGLKSINANRILDVGCGHGEMAAKLTKNGFTVTGIDPSSEAISAAQANHPQVRFLVGTAENPPLVAEKFEAAYFLNSLHHVPHSQMKTAILTAARLVAPNGVVMIIEPLASGSFFRAMRPVEDESEIRAKAANAVDELIADGSLELLNLQRWDRENRFRSLQDFTDYLLKVDSQREKSIQENSAKFAKSWRENVTLRDNQAFLTQPLVCWTLKDRLSFHCK